LRSTNELELRFLDWASIHSKIVPVVDPTSNARPKDLAKKSGEPIEARVANGQVQDIGMLVPPTAAQFAAVAEAADRKTQQLAGAFLLESELQPHQERVTAAQIRRIALELEGALGGIYTPIADDQQEPLIRRVLWQMRRDGLLPPLPDEGIEIRLLTGIAALAREIDRANLLNVMQTILAIPGAAERVNFDILIDLVMRWSGIYEQGLIKDVEQARQERLELQQEAVAGAAAQQAIETTGAIAEEQATQQIQGAQ
jgi:hypothetical protein